MKVIPHEFPNMAKLGDTTKQSNSSSEYTIQRTQANIREAKTKRRAVFVYVCVRLCVLVYVCLYMCLCVCVFMYVFVCTCMYVFVYICVCIFNVCICMSLCVCTYVCLHVYVCAFVQGWHDLNH